MVFESRLARVFIAVVVPDGKSGAAVGIELAAVVEMVVTGTAFAQIPARVWNAGRTSWHSQGASDHHHPAEHRDRKHDQRDATQAGNAKIPLLHQGLVPQTAQKATAPPQAQNTPLK